MSETKPENVLTVVKEKSASFFSVAKTFVVNNMMTIGLVVAVLAILTFLVFFLKDYFTKKFSAKIEGEDDDGEQTCEVMFFYTTWCPYCKKAMPVWQEFSKQWNGRTKNGYTIITTEIDCDQNEPVANKFDVQGYPTIKCIMNGKVADFDAKPTVEALNQFLQTCFS